MRHFGVYWFCMYICICALTSFCRTLHSTSLDVTWAAQVARRFSLTGSDGCDRHLRYCRRASGPSLAASRSGWAWSESRHPESQKNSKTMRGTRTTRKRRVAAAPCRRNLAEIVWENSRRARQQGKRRKKRRTVARPRRAPMRTMISSWLSRRRATPNFPRW